MPELPEVETIVRELAPRLIGHRVSAARLAKTDVLRRVSKPRLLKALKGARIAAVERRAKHAVFRLASGDRVVIQPRMTGSLIVYDRPLSKDEARYAVLTCTLDDGSLFVYRDVRRLGTVWLLDERGWARYTARFGPEPLDDTFTPFVFAARLRGTKAAIKKARPNLTATQVSQLSTFIITLAIVSSLVGIGLWLWMAKANSQGRNWARILSSVLFLLATLDMFGVFSQPKTLLGLVFPVLTWLVGAGAVFFLWRPESTAFFKPRGYG